ncbi:hypothetical protein EWM64_g1935 [Hericium alpestre]|uniref:WD repeat-containing protein 75 second beta-propeller domain-containing protein n=1 Tax=Hericium alpestre TaxID=135208 RepID=A0A4Z0A6W1_9AGAM|nr:hypothetical protein EWM64_g1935 [Hericium alpestre]
MAASKPKTAPPRPPNEVPLPDSPEKPAKRKLKRGKGKEESSGAQGRVQDEGGQTFAEGPAEASTSASASQETSWPWVSLTESSASRHPPVFTKDGSYFFSIVGSSVKIYSSSTGQIVSTLSAAPAGSSVGSSNGHTDLITSAVLNPHNAFQLITASLDGSIKVWDFLDALLLQTVNLNQPIFHLAVHENFKDHVFVSAGQQSKKTNKSGKTIEDNCVVLRVFLKATAATAQSPIQKSSEITAVGKTRLTKGLAVTPNGLWLVAIGGHKAYVASTANLKAGFTKFVSPEALTCLACHPSEEYFATGDDKGNIRLWYCLNETIAVQVSGVESRAPTTTLHWHAHAVSALAFTHNGAYLLSGGEEAVLVIWQLHSGKKEFVPRVGAPISTISVSRASSQEEEYLLGLADSSFAFINAARLKLSRTFSRIKLDPAVSHTRPSSTTSVPLAVHSASSTLIIPSSHPSSLQIYSPSSSRLLSELEVAPSNRVSRKDEKALEPSRVERAVISPAGDWMATIDSREGDESFRGEVYLKMWEWDKAAGFWILSTRIDRPHGLKAVTALTFSPASTEMSGPLLISTGEDGNIKSWALQTTKDRSGNEEEFWYARSSTSFRQEIPRHAAWSSDGSLLAVALGAYVVLFDPATNTLIQALTTPECETVSSAYFVGSGGRYLITASNFDIVLWDLVTQSVQWHYRSSLPIDNIVPHPKSEAFIVLYQLPTVSDKANAPTRIALFKPSTPTPSEVHTVPFRLRSVAWYPQPSGQSQEPSSFSLVGITDTWGIVLFGSDVHVPSDEGSTAQALIDGAQGPQKHTLFQDIFGKSAFSDSSNLPPTTVDTTKPWNGKEIADIFNAPAYLMPSLETMFDPLITSFLKPRPTDVDEEAKPGPTAEDGADEDVEMDVDEQDDEVMIVGERQDRIVDWQEMNTFVEVFRQHAVKCPPPMSIPRNHSNGAETRNGGHKATNGTPAGVPKANGAPFSEPSLGYPSPASSPSSVPASPVAAGLKRKMVTSSP